MLLDGCHLCRSPEPKEAMVVNMMTRQIVSEYHGIEEVVIYSQPEESAGIVKTKIPFKLPNEPVSFH